MFYHPDFILYLWLFPLFFLILVPLFLSVLGLTRHIFLVHADADLASRENRQHARFPCKGTVAEVVTDGAICTGAVCNISRMGISLKNLPDKVFEKMDKLTIVIRGYGANHNLDISPRWIADSGSGRQIGAEILMASPGWGQFLVQAERISQG